MVFEGEAKVAHAGLDRDLGKLKFAGDPGHALPVGTVT